ncbi:MAG: hypothetical protein ABI783_05480 [Actinomycetota bacterium]
MEAELIDEARTIAKELLPYLRFVGSRVWEVLQMASFGDRLGIGSELQEVAERAPLQTNWTGVLRALLDGDFTTAADLYEAIGVLDWEARARLRAAQRLVSEGRRPDADLQLQRALAFYRSVGATRYVRESEALLAAAS